MKVGDLEIKQRNESYDTSRHAMPGIELRHGLAGCNTSYASARQEEC